MVVALGGAVGTLARYGLSHAVPDTGGVPVATLVENVVGAFLLGLLLEALARSGPDVGRRRLARLGLGTGLLGAFWHAAGYHHSPDQPEPRFVAWCARPVRTLGRALWLMLPLALTGTLPPVAWIAVAILVDGLRKNLEVPAKPARKDEKPRDEAASEPEPPSRPSPAELVHETGAGAVVDIASREEIRMALPDFLSRVRAGTAAAARLDEARRFSRREQARELADLFSRMVTR